MLDVSFAYPACLLLLAVALPAVAGLWWLSFRAALLSRRAYGEDRLLDKFSRRLTLASQSVTLAGWLAAVSLIIVAASGPILPHAPTHVRAGSLEVVAAFDVSESMAAEDYRDGITGRECAQLGSEAGSRLDQAKSIVKTQIMPAVEKNKLGYVTYRGDGFPQADLSDDFTALTFVLDHWVRVGNAPGGGSDYARGLGEAIEVFKRDGKKDAERVIVLFSDGGFTGDAASLTKVEQELNQLHIRLVILGLGFSRPAPIPQFDDTGNFEGCLQVDGKTATTSYDETTLRQLAAVTGGRYVHVEKGANLDLNWPTALAGAEKAKPESQNMYQYPLLGAFAIIVLLSLKGTSMRRLRRFSRKR